MLRTRLAALLLFATFPFVFQLQGQIKPVSSFADQYTCVPEAKSVTQKDPQKWGTYFFMAYCKCKAGVPSKQVEQQLVATMRSMRSSYNENMSAETPRIKTPALTSCTIVQAQGGAGGSGGGMSPEQKRMAEIQRSINNYKLGLSILNRAQARAKQTAAELQDLANLPASSDPNQIMNSFNNNMQAIEQLDERLRASINQGYMQDATTTLQQYNSGNMEGAGMAGLGILGSIAENEEAKEEVKKQRAALIQRKNEALLNAANQMIQANNNALADYLRSASVALEEDREQYFMQKAFYHSCYARSISQNFNYNNTAWAQDRCKNVTQPSFKRYYNPLHEQHYEAALRKRELFDKYSNEVLLQGAIQHASTAIDMQPDKQEYYIALGRIANPSDLVLSLSNYVAAYEIDQKTFDQEYRDEMALVAEMAALEAAKAIQEEDVDRVRDFIDAQLFELIDIEGLNMLEYAAAINSTQSLNLLLNRFVDRQSEARAKELTQSAIMQAAARGGVQSLRVFQHNNYETYFYYNGKRPIDYAFEGEQVESIVMLYAAASDNQQAQIQKDYGKTPHFVLAMSELKPDLAREVLDGALAAEDRSVVFSEILGYQAAPAAYTQNASISGNAFSSAQFAEALATMGDQLTEEQREQVLLAMKTNNYPSGTNKSATPAQSAKREINFANSYRSLLARSQTAAEDIRNNPELQQLALSAVSRMQMPGGDEELAIIVLERNFLLPENERELAHNLVLQSLRYDRAQLFAVLHQRGMTNSVEESEVRRSLISSGTAILRQGYFDRIDFSGKGEDGGTLVHYIAFSSGDVENLTYLVQKNLVDINATGPHGWTALHYAVRNKNLSMVKKLMALNADPDIEDEWGRDAFDLAKERDLDDIRYALYGESDGKYNPW